MSGNKVIIIKPIVPLRQKPELGSELADEVLFGMELEILEKKEEWLYIETAYGYRGYIEKSQVRLISEGWVKPGRHSIIAAFADVLAEPKYSAQSILTVPRGASIMLTEEKQEKWLKTILPWGAYGWIREEAVLKQQDITGSALRQALVDTALLYLGTQYRWGGKTPMGIDCSGLTSMAYMLNGLMIPRDSDDQMNELKKISRKDSKPGDLLFFPGHVAMYIGEDKFVHATGTDAVVKINSLNKDSRLYRKDLDEKYITSGTVF